jgi:hypothetical protein
MDADKKKGECEKMNWKTKRRLLIARDMMIATGIGLIGIIVVVSVAKGVRRLWM